MPIHQRQISNGLCVIIEEMEHVESASYDLLTPCGLVSDEEGHIGASIVLAELISKGAGALGSRELSDAFDSAGIRHGEGVGMDRFTISGSLVAGSLDRALELVVSMVLQPQLPEQDIEPIQSVLLQDIEALKDNPARRSMVELSRRFYPAPLNRSPLGESDGIRATNRDLMQRLHRDLFKPDGAILSIAGKVEASRVFGVVEELFGDWQGDAKSIPDLGPRPKNEYFHISERSAQSQIVLSAPSVKFSDELYYDGKLVASILGSSMFGRLFVELREKRGLCYSVYARHTSSNLYGTMSAYVGTTPERAQESIDLLLGELGRLPKSITQEELDRSRTNLKASLVMGEESPGSRAASNAGDWWLLKRVRSLSEIKAAIDAVSLESLEEFLCRYPFTPCSVLTLGSEPLTVSPKIVGC